jgi:uncharacterized phage protein (TIGR02216 family)
MNSDRPSPNPSRKREGNLFAETATQLSGQTALLLHWRPDDFWNATPAELTAILSAMLPQGEAADGSLLEKLMTEFPDG